MVPLVHEICHKDSQHLAGPIFHPPVASASVFRHIHYFQGGDLNHSTIEVTACIDYSLQSQPIHSL
jgi:hypothetical protein